MTAEKHLVSFVGSHVSRCISHDDVIAYLKRKRFRIITKADLDDLDDEVPPDMSLTGTDLFTRADSIGFSVEDLRAAVLVRRTNVDSISLRTVAVHLAVLLGVEANQVLREIAGDVVDIASAWDALVRAAYAAKLGNAVPDNYADESAEHAFLVAVRWRALATHPAHDGDPVWLRIVHAAEDLAATALGEMTAARAHVEITNQPLNTIDRTQ